MMPFQLPFRHDDAAYAAGRDAGLSEAARIVMNPPQHGAGVAQPAERTPQVEGSTSSGFEYWDVGEEFNTRPPNFGETSVARVFKALIACDGQLLCSFVAGMEDDPDHLRCVLYRIKLVRGFKKRFEELSGYILTRTPIIRGQ
jgi:hypothetical protein